MAVAGFSSCHVETRCLLGAKRGRVSPHEQIYGRQQAHAVFPNLSIGQHCQPQLLLQQQQQQQQQPDDQQQSQKSAEQQQRQQQQSQQPQQQHQKKQQHLDVHAVHLTRSNGHEHHLLAQEDPHDRQSMPAERQQKRPGSLLWHHGRAAKKQCRKWNGEQQEERPALARNLQNPSTLGDTADLDCSGGLKASAVGHIMQHAAIFPGCVGPVAHTLETPTRNSGNLWISANRRAGARRDVVSGGDSVGSGCAVFSTISPAVSPAVSPSVSPAASPAVAPAILPAVPPAVSPAASPAVFPALVAAVVPTLFPISFTHPAQTYHGPSFASLLNSISPARQLHRRVVSAPAASAIFGPSNRRNNRNGTPCTTAGKEQPESKAPEHVQECRTGAEGAGCSFSRSTETCLFAPPPAFPGAQEGSVAERVARSMSGKCFASQGFLPLRENLPGHDRPETCQCAYDDEELQDTASS